MPSKAFKDSEWDWNINLPTKISANDFSNGLISTAFIEAVKPKPLFKPFALK